MALTYAGVDLATMTPALSDICDRWWIREAPALWTWPGYEMDRFHHLPIPAKPSAEPAPLNTLVWPTGASRWASFHSLIGTNAAVAIEAAVGSSTPIVQPLVISDPVNGQTVTTNMHLLGLRPVFVEDDSRELWLMTLVDERYFWWQQALTYNFAAGDSWSVLLAALFNASGSSFPLTVDAVSAAYGTPSPARWGAPGRPIPLLIDAAAMTVGHRFIRKLDGTCRYINWGASNSDESNRWTANSSSCVMGGRTRVEEVIGNVPANVLTSFWGDTQAIHLTSLASLALPAYGAASGVTGANGWIAADMRADDTVPNRTAYALQSAQDWYLWRLSLTDATFRGVRNIDVTGQEDRIEWEYEPGRQSRSAAEPITGPLSDRLPWERILTRIVRDNWGDGNIYGDRPPPGYSYSVRLTAQRSATSGSASGGSGSGSCRPWKANIRIVRNGQVIDGPQLGFGDDDYVLYSDCTCGTPSVGDKGVAIPDPFSPFQWLFVPANCGGSSSGSGSMSGSSGSSGSSSSGGVPAVYSTHCIGGLLRVTSGTLRFVNGALSWSNLVVRTEGCCTCVGSGSASGSSSGVGPGWYCLTCSVSSPSVAFYDSPPPSFCAGPYNSEMEAIAACTGVLIPNACCLNTPSVLSLAITGTITATVPLLYDAVASSGFGYPLWRGTANICGGVTTFDFYCPGPGTGWLMNAYGAGNGLFGGSSALSCSPFSWTDTNSSLIGGTCPATPSTFAVTG